MEETKTYTIKISQFMSERITTTIKYGQGNCQERFLEIAKMQDKTERNKQIDKLVENLEFYADQNGFFRHDEKISANFGIGDWCFKLDDKEIYYTLFDRFAELKQKYPDWHNGAIHDKAVRMCLEDYLGGFSGDLELRNELLTPNNYELDRITTNIDDVPSISKMRNKDCAMCAERASIAHNLWLLGGYESSFVATGNTILDNIPTEGHAYCIITQIPNRTYLVFDDAQEVYESVEATTNPRDTILNREPFVVKVRDGREMVYANADKYKEQNDIKTQERTL